jgi:uncharacterized protein
MIQPIELKLELPMKLANDVMSTTTKVWAILSASRNGDLDKIKSLIAECPELAYAQYNYTPPIHFAVREGYTDIVTYLLGLGANSPAYRIYPFLESLEVLADDRGFDAITKQLNEYQGNPALQKFKGDNGEILYNRTDLQKEFEQAVDKEDLQRTRQILEKHPEFALDKTFFWSEGILLFAAKECNYAMIDLLMSYGAKVPGMLKWTQFYYFERYDAAEYIMSKGMNPNTMSWQHVTILHDMAQKGNIPKAELLIKYGASKDPIDEEYQSTPLGMAARWGHIEMVEYLLKQGSDPNKSGAVWSTPLTWARKKGHSKIEDILMRAGAKK